MNEMNPIISVRGLSVIQNNIAILGDISWDVMPGEHWVIIGANGSGKTTLLNVLNAYMPPASGVVRVCGERYGFADWRELRISIGIVSTGVSNHIQPGEPGIDIVVSGKYAMINYWGEIDAADRERAMNILNIVGCAHLTERPWRFLSQGERQRLLIGRALMAESRLLILDEPCAGLDPVAREKFLDFIDDLARGESSPTFVLVTHHVGEIMPCFSKVLVMKEGRVLAAGAMSETLTSEVLSEAFDHPLRIVQANTRFSLRLGK